MSNWKRNLLGVSDKVQCSTSRKNIFFSRILLVTLELLNWHVKCIVFVTYPLRSYARVPINGEIVYCYCYCWTIDRLPLAFTLDWRVSHHCSQSRQSHSEFSAQRKTLCTCATNVHSMAIVCCPYVRIPVANFRFSGFSQFAICTTCTTHIHSVMNSQLSRAWQKLLSVFAANMANKCDKL